MRATVLAMLVLIPALAAGVPASSAVGDPSTAVQALPMRTLFFGFSQGSETHYRVFTDQAEWSAYYRAQVGSQVPAVDFATEMVLVAKHQDPDVRCGYRIESAHATATAPAETLVRVMGASVAPPVCFDHAGTHHVAVPLRAGIVTFHDALVFVPVGHAEVE